MLVAEAKLAAQQGDAKFYTAKIATARFFGDHVLSQAKGLRDAVVNGSGTVMALDEEQFLAA